MKSPGSIYEIRAERQEANPPIRITPQGSRSSRVRCGAERPREATGYWPKSNIDSRIGPYDLLHFFGG